MYKEQGILSPQEEQEQIVRNEQDEQQEQDEQDEQNEQDEQHEQDQIEHKININTLSTSQHYIQQ